MPNLMRAKTFSLAYLFGVIAIGGLYYAAVDNLAVVQRTIDYSYRAFLLKASAPVSGKLIIDGGSSSIHGIDSRKIESRFGRLTINLGDNAKYPLAYKIHRLKPYLKASDTVLLTLEWNQYAEGNVFSKEYVDTVFDERGSNSFYYNDLPFLERVWFIFTKVPFLLAVERIKTLNGVDSDKENLDRGESFSLQQFYRRVQGGERGDSKRQAVVDIEAVRARLLSTSCDRYILQETIANDFTVSKGFIQNLKLLQDTEVATGARFIFIWPNVVDSVQNDCYQSPEAIARMPIYGEDIKRVVNAHGFDFLGSYEDSHFDKSCFFDTYYHLLQECWVERTDKLIEQMEVYGLAKSAVSGRDILPQLVSDYLKSLPVNQVQITDLLEQSTSPDNEEFVSGWANPEVWGRWSLGYESHVLITNIDVQAQRLRIKGRYHHGAEPTAVWVNGTNFGEYVLKDRTFDLQGVDIEGGVLELRFRHRNPKSPKELGLSGDTRKIKFGLDNISLLGPKG